MRSSKRLRRVCGIAVLLATALMCVLVCVETVGILRLGEQPFTPQRVSESWQHIRWSLWLWFALVLCALLVGKLPQKPAKPAAPAPVKGSPVLVRWLLLAVGVGLLAWGVLNGGMRDVLVKAINICSECIGLG